MKTKVLPGAASRSKTAALSSPLQQLTTEQVRATQRRRVIDQANRRMKKQHQSRLERSRKIKVYSKTPTPEVPPRRPTTDRPPAVVRKLPTVPSAAAAEPRLTPKAIRALEFAVKSMERKNWSLNRRRLVAYHHLQSDRALTDVSPDDLMKEPSTNQ